MPETPRPAPDLDLNLQQDHADAATVADDVEPVNVVELLDDAGPAEEGSGGELDPGATAAIAAAGGEEAFLRGPSDAELIAAGWTQDSIELAARVSYVQRAVPAETEEVVAGYEDVPSWLRPRQARPGAATVPEAGVGAAIVRLARFWTWTAWWRGDFAGDAHPVLAAAVGWDRWTAPLQNSERGQTPGALEARRAWSFFCAVRDDLILRRWSPNSPAWYNAGLWHSYGLRRGTATGAGARPGRRVPWGPMGAPATEAAAEATAEGDELAGLGGHRLHDALFDIYGAAAPPGARPLHACYIQAVEDNLDGPGGILDLAAREAAVFRFGGGSGSNYAALRGRGEPLSGGGTSSGLLSFVAGLDGLAGAIKSGGTTRRAAKMIVVDGDHPDVFDFCAVKLEGEHVAKSLAVGSAVLASLGDGAPYTLAWAATRSAYRFAPGQNGNNSVRLDGTAFWKAVDAGASWLLRPRTGGEPDTSRSARELLDAIVEGAWGCGDPGVQWDDLIQAAHTCPGDGRINASNPCSEYLFLDDTACNLASVNLAHPSFDGAGTRADRQARAEARLFAASVRAAWVLDLVVSGSAYPTARIAARTARTRTIGLGPMDVAGRLIREGLAYDSDAGRDYAAYAMGVIGAGAWSASASLAAVFGPAPAFQDPTNASALAQVMSTQIAWHVVRRHEPALGDAAPRYARDVRAWGPATLLRNAQLTVCAPTGTIALVAGCDGTGIEPLWRCDGYDKVCADGRTLQIEPRCVAFARRRRPHLAPGVLVSAHELSPEAHLRMVAAIQPWVSGGISKTVNLPAAATREDVARVMRLSHELGVKCLSVYRDGSKASQPLGSTQPDAFVAAQLERYVDAFTSPKTHTTPRAPEPAPRDRRLGRHAASQWNGRVGVRALYLTVTGSPPVQIRVDAPTEPGEAAAIQLAARLSSRLLQAGVSLDELADMWEASGADGVSGGPVVPADGPVRFAPSILAAAGRLMRQTPSTLVSEQDAARPSPSARTGPLAEQGALVRVLDEAWACTVCGGPQRQTGTCRTCTVCGASSGGCA